MRLLYYLLVACIATRAAEGRRVVQPTDAAALTRANISEVEPLAAVEIRQESTNLARDGRQAHEQRKNSAVVGEKAPPPGEMTQTETPAPTPRMTETQAKARASEALGIAQEGQACMLGKSNEKLGCKTGCQCSWHDQCYSMHAAFVEAEEGADGDQVWNPERFDVGVCNTAVAILVLLALLLFSCTLSFVVLIRMYLMWRDLPDGLPMEQSESMKGMKVTTPRRSGQAGQQVKRTSVPSSPSFSSKAALPPQKPSTPRKEEASASTAPVEEDAPPPVETGEEVTTAR